LPSDKPKEPIIEEKQATAEIKTMTEQESQQDYEIEQQKKFFDEDDEILEVNFD